MPPDSLVKAPKSIIVIKTSALGDVIHALPSLHSLRGLFPKAGIHWVVEPRFLDLLPGKPWIDSKVLFDKAALKGFKLLGGLLELRRNLRALKPDLAIDLQGNLKSTLIAFLSGCQKRIGYCEMREGSGFYTKAVFGPHCRGHVIERYRDVVRSLGAIPEELAFPLPDFSREAEAAKERLKILRIDKPLAVIFPGAGWSSKLWGADNYALLAQVLTYRGLKVAIGGSGADLEIARKVIELSKPLNLINLLGRTTLRELMGLTSQAAICIGADTGPIHVAAAVGTPTVTLFGPSSGERAGTLGPRAVNVSTTASCSPCFKKTCPKEFICMGMITPKAVYDACDKALGK